MAALCRGVFRGDFRSSVLSGILLGLCAFLPVDDQRTDPADLVLSGNREDEVHHVGQRLDPIGIRGGHLRGSPPSGRLPLRAPVERYRRVVGWRDGSLHREAKGTDSFPPPQTLGSQSRFFRQLAPVCLHRFHPVVCQRQQIGGRCVPRHERGHDLRLGREDCPADEDTGLNVDAGNFSKNIARAKHRIC